MKGRREVCLCRASMQGTWPWHMAGPGRIRDGCSLSRAGGTRNAWKEGVACSRHSCWSLLATTIVGRRPPAVLQLAASFLAFSGAAARIERSTCSFGIYLPFHILLLHELFSHLFFKTRYSRTGSCTIPDEAMTHAPAGQIYKFVIMLFLHRK